MADTGWKSPGTVVNDSAVGTEAWDNPSYASFEDGNYADIWAMSSTFFYSNYLKATNFGFSIPSGATISGIEVRIKRYCVYQYTYDEKVSIVLSNGSIGSANKAKAEAWASLAYFNYGSSSDLWSQTWSSSDINDTDFGVVLQVKTNDDSGGQIGNDSHVDHIQIKVYYTEPGTTYSRESASSLGSDDTSLATVFSEADYTTVGTDDDNYVNLEGIQEYFQFLFKEKHTNNTDNFRITWKGKSTLAPSISTVYLQIYNRTTSTWTTLASNNTASANTKFTLESTISSNLSDYYDSNYVISARVYQDVIP